MSELNDLAAFLVSAKKHGYASGVKGKKTKDGAVLFEYSEGEWHYTDQYYGEDAFLGHETVWRKETPVWGMNYHGVIMDKLFDAGRLLQFLRESLLRVEASNPLRGPETYGADDLKYTNFTTGNLGNFRGVEIIYQTGRAIYQLDYHGGAITELSR